LLWILWTLRRISRLRRRIFGKTTPHWFKDGLSLVSFVNILDLMPNLCAITLSPRHFYNRIPQVVSNKRTWYKTPIKFLSSGITLIIILLFFFDFEILEQFGLTDKTLVARYLLVICLTAPLTIPLVALIFRIGLTVLSSVPGTGAGSGPNLSLALPNLLVPLSPWTYARLDNKHFF
jgi:hypothetical protein